MQYHRLAVKGDVPVKIRTFQIGFIDVLDWHLVKLHRGTLILTALPKTSRAPISHAQLAANSHCALCLGGPPVHRSATRLVRHCYAISTPSRANPFHVSFVSSSCDFLIYSGPVFRRTSQNFAYTVVLRWRNKILKVDDSVELRTQETHMLLQLGNPHLHTACVLPR